MKSLQKFKGKKVPLFFLCTYISFVPMINAYLKLLEQNFNVNYNTVDITIWNFFTVLFKSNSIAIIWIIINVILILTITNIKTTIRNSKIETEGVNLKRKDGTFGTADWASKEEIKEYLSVGKRKGIILGKTEENEIITLPLNTYLNKNIAVFGSSGSKKSRRLCYTKCNGIITRVIIRKYRKK